MNKLTFYRASSPISTGPHIALCEAEAEFSIVEKAADNQSPALQIYDQLLTENAVILYWIAQTFPGAGLLPAAGSQETRQLSWLVWLATALQPAMTRPCSPPAADNARTSRRPGDDGNIAACLQSIDAALTGRRWLFEVFTVADACLFASARWARAFFCRELDRDYPELAAHYTRMRKRPAVQSVLDYETRLDRVA